MLINLILLLVIHLIKNQMIKVYQKEEQIYILNL